MASLETGMDGPAALGDLPPSMPLSTGGGDAAQRREAGFRYVGVLVLTLALVLILVASPASNWSRALGLALELTALVVVVATSREREGVRRHRSIVLGGVAGVVVVLVAAGAMPAILTFAIGAVLSLLIPAALLGGLFRLIRRDGVTLQVVAGALAIYLLVGLLFAFAISIATHVAGPAYFGNGSDGSLSERVYYSFTVLTTTGFGDFTAAHPYGRGIAVLEMLTGQLYLVTVIGVLVGDIAGRRLGSGS